MYSLGVVLMYTQAVQAEIGREIEDYQMINASAERIVRRMALRVWLTRLYHSTLEKISRLSNSRRNEIKVAGCS